jgi:gas vesicle protein
MPEVIVKGGNAYLRHPWSGNVQVVPESEAAGLMSSGLVPATDQEYQEFERGEKYGGAGGGALAALASAGRGLSFGLSDVALTKGAGIDPSHLRALNEYNPTISTGGEITGSLLGFLVPGGAAAKVAGGAAKAGGKAATSAARLLKTTETAFVPKLAGAATREGAIGAAFGAGQGISDVALSEKDLSGVDMLLTIAKNAGTGAGFGAGLGALSSSVGHVGKRAFKKLSSNIDEMKTLRAEKTSLEAERAAMAARGVPDGALAAADEQIAAVGMKLKEVQTAVATRVFTKSLGLAIGNTIGGPIGMGAGYLFAPKAFDVLKTALRPLSKAARSASSAIRKDAIRAFTAAETVSKPFLAGMEGIAPNLASKIKAAQRTIGQEVRKHPIKRFKIPKGATQAEIVRNGILKAIQQGPDTKYGAAALERAADALSKPASEFAEGVSRGLSQTSRAASIAAGSVGRLAGGAGGAVGKIARNAIGKIRPDTELGHAALEIGGHAIGTAAAMASTASTAGAEFAPNLATGFLLGGVEGAGLAVAQKIAKEQIAQHTIGRLSEALSRKLFPGIKAVPYFQIGAKRMNDLREEVHSIELDGLDALLRSQFPVNTPEPIQREISQNLYRAIGYLQATTPPPGDDPVPTSEARDSGNLANERQRARLEAVIQPDVVAEKFSKGKLIREHVEALEAVYPKELSQLRAVVSAEVARAKAGGGIYTPEQAQQIGLLLGTPRKSAARYQRFHQQAAEPPGPKPRARSMSLSHGKLTQLQRIQSEADRG